MYSITKAHKMSDIFLQAEKYVHFYYKHVRTKLVFVLTCQTMSEHYLATEYP